MYRFLFFPCIFSLNAAASEQSLQGVDYSMDATEIAVRATENRQRIQSGIVEVESRLVMIRKGHQETQRRKITTYFDAERVRGDYVLPYDADYKSGERFIESISHADVFRYYSDRTFPDGGTMATLMRPKRDNNDLAYKIPDPRLIGMVAESYLNLVHGTLNTYLDNPRYVVRATTVEEHNAIPCAKLTLNREEDSFEVTLWIAPEYNFTVVAITTNYKAGKRTGAVECELARVEGYGWFPSTVHYKHVVDGKLDREEWLAVRVEQFNEALDDQTFEFAGMGVPEGAQITDTTDDERRFWEMTKTGLAPWKPRPLTGVIAGGDGWGRWFLVGSGVFFAGLAIWLLWRKWAVQ